MKTKSSEAVLTDTRYVITGLAVGLLFVIVSVPVSACHWNPCPCCGGCVPSCSSPCFPCVCKTCTWKCGDNSCCNGTCYDSTTQGCCNGTVYNKATQTCCGGQVETKGNCMDCIDGIWISTCNPAQCQTCVNNQCVVCGGDPNQACCNGTVYNKATQTCCGGQVQTKGNCMDCINGVWASTCYSEYCESCVNNECKVCDDNPFKCCVNGECKDRCGSSCPCGDNQYCCGSSIPGDQICCDIGDLCCVNTETGSFCSQPCEVTVIDCTSCAKSKEEDYKCPGCLNIPFSGGCLNYTYREYTGLEIKGCDHGCRHDMGDKPCYYERRCVDAHITAAALCMVFGNGELGCVPDYNAEGEDATPGISCDECGTGGEIVDQYDRYTCKNCYDN